MALIFHFKCTLKCLQFVSIWTSLKFFSPGNRLTLYQTTKFGRDQIESICRRPNVAKMPISLYDKSRKHCGKRRKCWLPAFSTFHTVFSKAFFFSVVKSRDCVGKISSNKPSSQLYSFVHIFSLAVFGENRKFCYSPLPNKSWFLHVCSRSVLKTLWEKEKLLEMSNFLYPRCFLPIYITFCHCDQIYNYCLHSLSV